MKLSISNIAWQSEDEEQILELLRNREVQNIELAPTKKWASPVNCTTAEVEEYKMFWKKSGFEPVAMQSLLFGQPELIMFGNENKRAQLLQYLKKMIKLAGDLGTKAMVFGSPKNRLAGSLSVAQRLEIAEPFFYELGETALEHNVLFCIEPNPVQYGCDFITNTEEGIEFVRRVNHPGFRLHLDAAAMRLNEEDYFHSIEKSMPYLAHFHVSQPYLGLVGSDSAEHHKVIAHALRMMNYMNFISIEMKSGVLSSDEESVMTAVDFVKETYFM
ncbi:sugar phosphate isomerase/epimerase family protein [Gorillibacterium timonense]|uniref:sugar phosphate isomerase/epimerase family protein n=1 Tax=Gorillibacterium timonense TaxID=1689269 RepID=UPI00071D79C1|nr:sugar phosphate isomerase/epimerase [Gorillibacterium timonense]